MNKKRRRRFRIPNAQGVSDRNDPPENKTSGNPRIAMSNFPEKHKRSIGRAVLIGSAWMLALRWGIRGIGMLSVIILARLLTPDDYGIIALATVVVGFVELFTMLGVQTMLIRTPSPSVDDYNTAWTIALVQGLIVCAVMQVIAPFAADYFHDDRLTAVIRLLALRAAMFGAMNIGIVDFTRTMNFSKEFQLGIAEKCSGFTVVVISAFLLRSYWALVLGMLVSPIVSVSLSYALHPYRPKISFAKLRKFLRFSIWIFVANLGNFVSRRIDQIAIGRVADTYATGTYTLGMEMATMVTGELRAPLERTLLPAYSRLSSDRSSLVRAYLASVAGISAICLATGIGLSAVAPAAVAVVLGAKWGNVAPILEYLGVFAAMLAISETATGAILIATGREAVSAALIWVRAVAFALVVVVVATNFDVVMIAKARMITVLVLAFFSFHAAGRALGIPLGSILSVVWRPAFAAGAMFMAVRWVLDETALSGTARLGLSIAVGGAVYIVALGALWVYTTAPDCVERQLLRRISRRG